ncbi:unnamed protein product [Ectocarpus sp. 12 AP-2014]
MRLMVLRLAAGARGRTRWQVSTRQLTLPASKALCICCRFRATFLLGQHALPPLFGRCPVVHRRGQFLSESFCTNRPRSSSGADFLARFLKLWAAAKSGGR